jgi:hypothetical protein
MKRSSIVLAVVAGVAWGQSPPAATFVVSSPGSPGSTEEARSRMDAFAGAIGGRAGLTLAAVYEPTDAGGAKRLADSGLGLVSLPFFLAHERELGLHARLQAVAKDRPALETWALIGGKGKPVKSIDKVMTSLAFAPAFVRGVVAGGQLPAGAQIVQSTTVLSSLRKAAAGEPIAVVVDGAQQASLASLPFAAKLDVLAHSQPVPAGIVVTVDRKLPAKDWPPIESALLGAAKDSAAALEGLQVTRFEPIDDKALQAARKAYAEGAP